MKNLLIEKLSLTSPLIAFHLRKARILHDYSNRKLVIHVRCDSDYEREVLSCQYAWPKIHEAISEILKTYFTLNFIKNKS